jgi:Cu(I)/Ag(I) efflux system periplasmic protein CusF
LINTQPKEAKHMKLRWFTLVTAIVACAAVAPAQSTDMKNHKENHKAASGQAHKASGKVTKVDKSAGAVTIAHGPVASMNWPAMAMAFKAKDKAMLDKVKYGDQVEFSFIQSGRDYIITSIK